MPRGGFRVGAGRPSKAATTVRAIAPVAAGLPADVVAPAEASGMTPLEYMLRVMRDPDEDPARRDRMAMAAAPFVHVRTAAAPVGKKERAAERADQAAGGKFRPRAAPLKVVSG